ncbi:30411_t:CDS:2, partial [Racocetra persica]
ESSFLAEIDIEKYLRNKAESRKSEAEIEASMQTSVCTNDMLFSMEIGTI